MTFLERLRGRNLVGSIEYDKEHRERNRAPLRAGGADDVAIVSAFGPHPRNHPFIQVKRDILLACPVSISQRAVSCMCT